MTGLLATFATLGTVAYLVFRRKPSIDDGPRERMRRTRATKIGKAPRGRQLKIVGTVSAVGAPIEAPFSGRACLYYRAYVERTVYMDKDVFGRPLHRDDHGVAWERKATESKGIELLVDDGTGRARVELGEVMVLIERDRRGKAPLMQDIGTAEQKWLRAQGVEFDPMQDARELRFSEHLIEEGDRIAVYGRPEWEADPEASQEAGYREIAAGRMVFRGDGIIVSDERGMLS